MKLEIVEELRFSNPWPWYILTVDGQEVYGSWNKELVEATFNKIISDGKFEKTVRKILKSHEVDVPLTEST
jgi:hypothetical protein